MFDSEGSIAAHSRSNSCDKRALRSRSTEERSTGTFRSKNIVAYPAIRRGASRAIGDRERAGSRERGSVRVNQMGAAQYHYRVSNCEIMVPSMNKGADRGEVAIAERCKGTHRAVAVSHKPTGVRLLCAGSDSLIRLIPPFPSKKGAFIWGLVCALAPSTTSCSWPLVHAPSKSAASNSFGGVIHTVFAGQSEEGRTSSGLAIGG